MASSGDQDRGETRPERSDAHPAPRGSQPTADRSQPAPDETRTTPGGTGTTPGGTGTTPDRPKGASGGAQTGPDHAKGATKQVQGDVKQRDAGANPAQSGTEPARDGSRTDGVAPPVTETPPGPDAGPAHPAKLGGRSLWRAARNTVREFSDDNLTDWAAALTYYGVLSIFPAILVMVSVVGLLGRDTVTSLVGNIGEMVPSANARDILTSAVEDLNQSQGAGLLAILGLLGAFWAASGYVGAFMRAANAVYDVPEGRPIWKTVPIRLAVTAAVGLMLLLSAAIVVLTGPVAERVGDVVGIGSQAVFVWDILKWPVLVLLVSLIIAVLYYASPNARQGGFRWVSPGSLLAVLVWIAASVGFSFYVANFGSYNKTYGAVASVIIFLVWLWISNIAILFGAEFDSELERQRAIQAGMADGQEPFMQLRDDRKVKDEYKVKNEQVPVRR